MLCMMTSATPVCLHRLKALCGEALEADILFPSTSHVSKSNGNGGAENNTTDPDEEKPLIQVH